MKILRRRLAAELRMAGHYVRHLWAPLFLVAAYALLATWVVRMSLAREGVSLPSFRQSLYEVYTQLYFAPAPRLPDAPIAELIYWITPMVGVVLVAQGLVRVGQTVFDPVLRERLRMNAIIAGMRQHVVVCGLGHVGFRVVESLLELGEDVVAIDRNAADPFIEIVKAKGVAVIVGDARRDELLLAAGIERARSVVSATDDDLVNLEVAIDAQRMNPAIKVVLRMFDPKLATKVGGALGVAKTFSTSALSGPLVALHATREGIRSVYRAFDTTRAVAELSLPASFSRQGVAEFERQWGVKVLCKERAELAVEAFLEADERVVIDGPLERLRAMPF